jgi:hypothetical protein
MKALYNLVVAGAASLFALGSVQEWDAKEREKEK